MTQSVPGNGDSGLLLVPDCTSCGLCCAIGMAIPVHKGEDVPKRYLRSVRNSMGFARWEAETHWQMHVKDGCCQALKQGPNGTCMCKIYARRPTVCREFERGSEDCLGILQAHAAKRDEASGPGASR